MGLMTRLEEAEKRTAGGKSEKGDTDHHKRKMIPLADGEYTGKQNFKGKRG